MDSPNVSSVSKAYSTEFSLHVGLIRQLTASVAKRAMACGVDYDFDDAYQDGCVAYTKAAKGYDPERGITFTAYLGRTIYNELNRQVQTWIECRSELHIQSIEDMGAEGQDILEVLEAPEESAEEILGHRQEMRQKVMALSAMSRSVIRELNHPSPELRQTIEQKQISAKAQRAMGKKFVRVPDSPTFALVAEHLGLSKREYARIRQEFREKLGVDL